MTVTVEVMIDMKEKEKAMELREKAEEFENSFRSIYGNRPSSLSIETLKSNYEYSESKASTALALYLRTKEWEALYEGQKEAWMK